MRAEHRKTALIAATIREIGEHGSLDIPVGQIARRAGVSGPLAFHYFGGKDQLFLAAMRHVLSIYGALARRELAGACGPEQRLEAILRASFGPGHFAPEVVAAWRSFYLLAQSAPDARRLLRVYQRRLHANLTHDLRPLTGAAAPAIAARIGALIDGIYLRAVVDPGDGTAALADVSHVLRLEIAAARKERDR